MLGTVPRTVGARRWIADVAAMLLLATCMGILAVAGVLPLTAPQQWVFGVSLVAIALMVDKVSRSYLMTLLMMLLSAFATFRYAVWRYGTLAEFFRHPSPERRPLDLFFMSVLALAELYTMLVLYLGYFQMAYPLKRKPVAMPDDVETWPHVDVLIPTYNEPLELVRYTVFAAMNMDWPAEKLHIFLLDDGRRQEFRDFAKRAGVEYVTRADNQGAKAGNINHALQGAHSPYVAIFDCDHVPVRSFLQFTMGWFFRDPKMALVQTPHHFYSPDPFERNLKQYREVPNEGQLFYGIVQVCNDFWNSSFFCGSCAVLRRQALDEAGGIATETVTEDAHTSLRMQKAGWNTAYLNTPQAAGLATERLSGHVKQRIRWARGMVQILRREKPLLAPGLTWAQRLCYFNAMLHFLYALPRLVFLTAPLVYLLFGYRVLPGSWGLILAFAMPHLLLAQITNSRIQGEHRHSFWNEVYETVLAPYILLPTLLALVSPKSGKFNVTDKGGVVAESYLDLHMAQPFFVLLFFNLLGMAMVPVRLFYLDRMHPGTVLINALWDLLSIVIIGVVIGVAHESQQRRQSIRIAMRTLAWIVLPDGSAYEGSTVDLSAGGSAIHLDDYLPPSGGVEVQLVLPRPSGSNVALPARIVGGGGRVVRVQFQELSVVQERKLVGVLFSRANAWLNWADETTHDSLWRSAALIVKLSGKGIGQGALSLLHARRSKRVSRRERAAQASVSTLLVLLFLGSLAGFSPRALAQERSSSVGVASTPLPSSAGRFEASYSLADLGVSHAIDLRGSSPDHALTFIVPETEMATVATLRVQYDASPSLTRIDVLLNGTVVAALLGKVDGMGPALERTVTLPAALLVHRNTLVFRMVGDATATACEGPKKLTVRPRAWAQIEPASVLRVIGSRIAIANNLSLLPQPFFERDASVAPTIAIVFLAAPSAMELQAASVVASWIGVMANERRAAFSVSIGRIPAGNAIVFAEPSAAPQSNGSSPMLPNAQVPSLAQIGLPHVAAPTLAMRANPGDAYGKLLVVAGADGQQLLEAAQSLVLNPQVLTGDTAQVSARLPALRQADDAPRWIQGNPHTTVGEMQSSSLVSDGAAPVEVYLRTVPDLYYGLHRNPRLHLFYRYNPSTLAAHAQLTVSMNHVLAGSVPLPPEADTSVAGQVVLTVPAAGMTPFGNSLGVYFFLPAAKAGLCRSGAIATPAAAVLAGSYLDVKAIPHWAALPNLQLFSNAGFPFTRFADLAQTEVILPPTPSAAEVRLLLTLMAHMGAETGYPALRVIIGSARDLGKNADRDLLILSTAKNQPAMGRLGSVLPVVATAQGLDLSHLEGKFTPIADFWDHVQGRPVDQSSQVHFGGSLPVAILEGGESPYHVGRSVVLVMVKDDAAVTPFLSAFGDALYSSSIAQSVSILYGNSFRSYRLGHSLYHVGKLPPWDFLSFELAAYPYFGAVVLLLVCFLMALVAQAWLRHHALERLREGGDGDRNEGAE